MVHNRQLIDVQRDHAKGIVKMVPECAAEAAGPAHTLEYVHIQTGSTDFDGRLGSGTFQSAEAMDDGRIDVKRTGTETASTSWNSFAVPIGNDPLGRPRAPRSTASTADR